MSSMNKEATGLALPHPQRVWLPQVDPSLLSTLSRVYLEDG